MKSLIFMGYPPPPPHILLGINLLIVNYLLRNPIRSLTPVDGLYKQQISE